MHASVPEGQATQTGEAAPFDISSVGHASPQTSPATLRSLLAAHFPHLASEPAVVLHASQLAMEAHEGKGLHSAEATSPLHIYPPAAKQAVPSQFAVDPLASQVLSASRVYPSSHY